MKINPINAKLKPLVEEFLDTENLQDKFLEIANKLGYKGNDPVKVKVSLFTPDEHADICFANNEVAELFIDYQIEKQLNTVTLYRELLKQNPEAKDDLIAICRNILDGKEVDMNAILSLFPE